MQRPCQRDSHATVVGISSACCPLETLSRACEAKGTCKRHARPRTRVAPVVRLLRCVNVLRRSDAYTRGGALVVLERREMLRVYVKSVVLILSSRQPVRLCNTSHRLQQFIALQIMGHATSAHAPAMQLQQPMVHNAS
eukprot:365964-Chlamydomonas_euryale.AAC.10